MKILEQPRIPSKITLPKKFKKRKGEDPRGKAKFTLLHEDVMSKAKVLNFIALYKEDKLAARVKYFNSGTRDGLNNKIRYSFNRMCLFEWENGDYSINNIITTFGISTTGKMFSKSNTKTSIIFKDGKYWFREDGKVSPLKYSDVIKYRSFELTDKIYSYLHSKIHFLKTLSEFPFREGINFNTIVREKLTSLKDLYRFYFKVPYNIALLLAKVRFKEQYMEHKYQLVRYRGVFTNIQNLTQEMVEWPHFGDALHMALTLGEKVNCKWGLKRLKEEHDNWSRLIANTLLKAEPLRDLKIREDLAAFEEFSGHRLLKTNRDMLFEGLRQDHCVGTYITNVERGECAIFDVENYTLQLKIKLEKDVFGNPIKMCYNAQYLGYKNDSPPIELRNKVNDLIEAYNKSELFKSFDEKYGPKTVKSDSETFFQDFELAGDNDFLL